MVRSLLQDRCVDDVCCCRGGGGGGGCRRRSLCRRTSCDLFLLFFFFCSDCLFFSFSSSKHLVLTSLFSSLSNHSRRSNPHTCFSSNRLVSQVTHMGFLADTIIWDFNLAAERASGTTTEGKSGEIILCRLSQHKVKVRFFFL